MVFCELFLKVHCFYAEFTCEFWISGNNREDYCFHCFPQLKHLIKIVIGSSAERVCNS